MISFSALVGRITGKGASAEATPDAAGSGVATGGQFAALVEFASQAEAAREQGKLRLVVDNAATGNSLPLPAAADAGLPADALGASDGPAQTEQAQTTPPPALSLLPTPRAPAAPKTPAHAKAEYQKPDDATALTASPPAALVEEPAQDLAETATQTDQADTSIQSPAAPTGPVPPPAVPVLAATTPVTTTPAAPAPVETTTSDGHVQIACATASSATPRAPLAGKADRPMPTSPFVAEAPAPDAEAPIAPTGALPTPIVSNRPETVGTVPAPTTPTDIVTPRIAMPATPALPATPSGPAPVASNMPQAVEVPVAVAELPSPVAANLPAGIVSPDQAPSPRSDRGAAPIDTAAQAAPAAPVPAQATAVPAQQVAQPAPAQLAAADVSQTDGSAPNAVRAGETPVEIPADHPEGHRKIIATLTAGRPAGGLADGTRPLAANLPGQLSAMRAAMAKPDAAAKAMADVATPDAVAATPARETGKSAGLSAEAPHAKASDTLMTSAPLRAIVESLPPVIQSELGAAPVRVVTGPSTGQALGDQVIDMGVSGQWIDRMAREISALADGTGHSRFTLSPPNLGRLHVDLWRDQDATSIRLTTETDEAARRLSEGRTALQADARVAALNLGSITVEKSSSGFDKPQDQNHNQSQNQNQRFGGDLSGQSQQQAGSQSQARTNGQQGDWVSRIVKDEQTQHSDAASGAQSSGTANGRVRFA